MANPLWCSQGRCRTLGENKPFIQKRYPAKKPVHLETERLIIRDWNPRQDANHALDIYGDLRVTRWLSKTEPDQTIHDAQNRLQRFVHATSPDGYGIWAVDETAIDHLIGTILLQPLPDTNNQPTTDIEIGWHFRPASWGYGYATEAAHRILTYGWEVLKLPVIYAVSQTDNRRSIQVMKRLGMQIVGLTTQYYGGKELLLYRISAE